MQTLLADTVKSLHLANFSLPNHQEVTNSSIQLAEAAANYGALKVIFGVFMVVIILVILVFLYQFLTLTKKVSQIHESTVATQKYFEGMADRTVGPAQSQIIIRRAFNSLGAIIKYSIIRIRLENIESLPESQVRNKVSRVVRNEFSELTSFLANFICNEKPLSDIVDDEDIILLEDLMMEQTRISNEVFSIHDMDQSVNLVLNGVKLIYLKKI